MKRLLREVERLVNALPDGAPEKDFYSRRVRALGRACGCKTGALFLLVACVAYPAYVLLFIHNAWETIVSVTARGLLIAVSSALLGKLVGLTWARFQLVFLYRKLSNTRRA